MASVMASVLRLAPLLLAASAIQNIETPISEHAGVHALMRQEDLDAEQPAADFADESPGMVDALLEVSESSIEQGSADGDRADDVTASNGGDRSNSANKRGSVGKSKTSQSTKGNEKNKGNGNPKRSRSAKQNGKPKLNSRSKKAKSNKQGDIASHAKKKSATGRNAASKKRAVSGKAVSQVTGPPKAPILPITIMPAPGTTFGAGCSTCGGAGQFGHDLGAMDREIDSGDDVGGDDDKSKNKGGGSFAAK